MAATREDLSALREQLVGAGRDYAEQPQRLTPAAAQTREAEGALAVVEKPLAECGTAAQEHAVAYIAHPCPLSINPTSSRHCPMTEPDPLQALARPHLGATIRGNGIRFSGNT